MKKNYSGFTIVELIIVIIVISLLAMISVASYNTIQNKAKAAATEADVANIKKKYHLYVTKKFKAPQSLADLENSELGKIIEKIEWASSGDPGYGAYGTNTTKGRYYTFMRDREITIYYWDYVESAWKHKSEYDSGGDEGFARHYGTGNDRCRTERLEDCGQQMPY